MPGCTMWGAVSSAVKVSIKRSSVAAVSLLSTAGSVMTLGPKASTAPDSCTAMWPVSTVMTASQPRSSESMTVALVWVPPMRKKTSASVICTASRMRLMADWQ